MKNGRQYPKKNLAIGLGLLIAAITIVATLASRLSQVDISEEFAQKQIEQKLPLHKQDEVLFVKYDLDIDRVTLKFLDDNRVSVVADATIKTSMGEAQLAISTVGVPTYHDRAFYYKPDTMNLSEYSFSGKANENLAKAGQIAKNAADKLLRPLAKDTGIEFDSKEFADKFKAAAAKKIESLAVNFLSGHPIKKIDGLKGAVVGLAIKKIEIKDKVLTIHFSFLQLTMKLLGIAVVGIAAFAALVTAPWWASEISILAFLC